MIEGPESKVAVWVHIWGYDDACPLYGTILNNPYRLLEAMYYKQI